MKKHFVFVSFLIFGVFIFPSCKLENDNTTSCVDGTGQIVTETRTVDSFHSLSIRGIGNIFLTQGAPQTLRIETHEEVLQILRTQVVNEVLQIDLLGCIQGMINSLDIYITVPEIQLLSIEGVANITGENDFDVDSLSLELDGVGNITLQGTSDYLDINSSGVGNIHTFEMLTDTCDVLISGEGDVEVNVQDLLDVKISGSGRVYYKGSPTINTDISGSGSVINAN